MNQRQTSSLLGRIFILIVISFILAGCAKPPLEIAQMENVKKGMNPAQVQRLTGQAPKKQAQLTYQHQNYLIQSYRMKAGGKDSFSNICDKAGCHIRPVQTSASDYFFIYKKNGHYQLDQWGFKKDLANSAKPMIHHLFG